MSNSTITCVYTIPLMGSQSGAALLARMKLIPIDLTLPHLWGLRYFSDASSLVGSSIVRTVVFKMVPTSVATATASLDAGNIGSPVLDLTVTSAGDGYVAPAVVSISGGDAGNGTVPYEAATATAIMKMTSVAILSGGGGYQDGDVVVVSGGGWGPDVVLPTAEISAVVGGGVATVITVLTPGSGLTQPPDFTVVSNSGSGILLSAGLGVDSLSLNNAGAGYSSAPTVGMISSYVAAHPDTSDQGSSLANFMTQVFQAALNTDVIASIPVVS